ncbi:MAG: LysR family transcriptional regulator [Pseudomonadota bacterium]
MPRRKKAFSGTVSDVDLRLMRVFKTVIECGGLSAAQTELGVGRSSISRQISDLETRLGLRLCHRGRKGFYLTQSGRKALGYIEQLLNAADDFTSNIASISNRMVGKIHIGMIDYTVSDKRNPLVSVIREYQRIAAGVSVDLMSGSPNEVERGVIDGTLHIGIVPDYQRHPSLEYHKLYDEPVGLFCGGDHPLATSAQRGLELTEQEVCKHKLVFRGYFESNRLRQRKQKFPVGSTVYQTEAVLALVRSGIFLGFFPLHCQDLMDGEYYELLPAAFRYSIPICAVWRSDRRDSHILQEFLELLKSNG